MYRTTGKRTSLRSFALLVGAVVIVGAGGVLAAVTPNQASRLPHRVVADANGDVLGQVVGYQDSITLIAVEDGSNVAILQAEAHKLAARNVRVFYSSAGCEGTVYLPTLDAADLFSVANSVYGLQGVVYGVGEPNTAPLELGVLYKSSGARTTVTTNSEYIAQNTSGQCVDSQRLNQPVLPATEVIDFDATFTTPLGIE